LAEATLLVAGADRKEEPVVQWFDAETLESGRAEPTDASAVGARRLVGCGQSWPGQRVVVVDPSTNRTCPPQTVGEIWVSGLGVARGYWRRAEDTHTTFRAFLDDTGAGPFLRTGDLGFVHDGELFVTGRLKDLIIIAGRNHYPQDLEATVESSHPALRSGSSAAFAEQVEESERLVIVAEVRRSFLAEMRSTGDGQPISPDARAAGLEPVIRAVRYELARVHEVSPSHVLLTREGSIPKTSSGKIQRSRCRAALRAGTLEVLASSPTTPAAGSSIGHSRWAPAVVSTLERPLLRS
jgi:acyl-CoA synthetase (AMP-forming)/AMP-acid ligase II